MWVGSAGLRLGSNSLQGSLRNLVLDITPGEQLASANAWHGRFAHLANILGFALGEDGVAVFAGRS